MEIILKAEPRNRTGSKVKSLRRDGLVPGVIFGKGQESKNIKVKYNELVRLINKVGETEVVHIDLEGKKIPVLISGLQFHPVKNIPLHVDFHAIDLKKKVTVNVPLEFTGQEEHPLLKNQNALLLVLVNEVEVEALPNDLPKAITLDISNLQEIGDVLTIKDVKKALEGKKVEVLEEDEEMAVAKLDYAEQIEEEEEGPQSVEDVEVTAQKEGEEGEGKEEAKAEETKEKEEGKKD